MNIRQEIVSDRQAIYQIHLVAFGQKDESELVDRLRSCAEFLPELSLIAEQDGQLVGHILFTRSWIKDVNGEEVPTLALAPIGILSEVQRQGIGGKLIRAGLEKARELGEASVNVLGHPEYYPRFGFEKAIDRGILCPFTAPEEAFMILELIPGALDNISGTVRYADAFMEME